MRRFIALFAVCIVQLCVASSASAVSVGSIANIFGAGLSTPPGGATFGAGVLPPGTTFSAAPGRVLHISQVGGFVGSVVSGNYAPNYDGHAALAVGTLMNPQQGISGIKADGALFLAGVFLDENAPTGATPATLDFRSSGLGESFLSLSPQIGQLFFIGDGLTGSGSGSVQGFAVPPTATRLFFGFADGIYNGTALAGDPDTYTNNVGGLGVTIEIVPELAAISLVAIGLTTLISTAFFRKREN